MTDHLPVEECVDRGVYEIRARNFSVGVFNAAVNGFIGIRQKFDARYLFTEYHYDTGGLVGTAQPVRLLGMIEEERVRLWERYPGSFCMHCGEPVEYRKELKGEYDPETKTFTSWPWVHVDEAQDDCIGNVASMTGSTYRPLFNILEDYDEMIQEEREQEDA